MEQSLFGYDLFGEPISPKESGILTNKFIVPPFSVLDARQGYWQERKRAWLMLGIQSELGREDTEYNIIDNELRGNPRRKKVEPNSKRGKKFWVRSPNALANLVERIEHGETFAESSLKIAAVGTGISIFDPVLCECMYTWFCPPGGHILDPFAGGSVRGIVAEWLGYKYTGIELRPEQVKANYLQAERLKLAPRYIVGDATYIKQLAHGNYDFVFSCPPYYNLEVYSDLDGELSALDTYEEFISRYKTIISNTLDLLNDDRFACFVVGNIRGNQGFYCNFVSDTILAFQDVNVFLYNDAVLISPYGSVPIRASKHFEISRKLEKTHQNVLVFVKGDWRKAVAKCNDRYRSA